MYSYWLSRQFFSIYTLISAVTIFVNTSATYKFAPLDEVIKETAAALKLGDAKRVSTYFSTNVSLSVKRDEGNYTKFQAELLLDEFFRANKVTHIKEVQKISNASNSFVVFSLKSNTNTFRVFIKFTQTNKDFQISELRIE
ncbi:DUF4783 domain-containing protein [Sphingobacterium suaedae]|uniref:DUF4783 domain-containing protein n=1 Tax=Sphingobacterium suaedae TaxID=1686402 RepID=A0ABW5KB34_9SPHI